MPKFAVLVSATAISEKGNPPRLEDLSSMMVFNEELRRAGVLLAAEGFLASSTGARISFNADGPEKPEYGPFGLDNLVAGYWFWKLDTIEEAVEWAKKIPFTEGRVEIRRVAGKEDFGDGVSEELEKRRAEIRKNAAGNVE